MAFQLPKLNYMGGGESYPLYYYFPSPLFRECWFYLDETNAKPFLPPDNIFYLMEYRELFLTLFRKFDEKKQPRSFLRDLVETTHLFLKMLEKFCKGRKNLVVQVSWGMGIEFLSFEFPVISLGIFWSVHIFIIFTVTRFFSSRC